MKRKAGEKFHDWTLISFCGEGAFGEVWYCRDISGKKIALKITTQKELDAIQNYQKLTTEKNTDLLEIFHVGESEEELYYTMEPADNIGGETYKADTLAGRLEKGPLSPVEYPEILYKIFQGIKVIHEGNCSHRDIKPENILFVNGKPKISDIGLMTSMTSTLTQLKGTFDYLPPDLVNGDTIYDKENCQPCDLYAFGKVIYCTITGNKPNEFPTVPKNLNIKNNVALKYFHRLSRKLCEKEPSVRLKKIEELTLEMEKIRDILERGETWKDRFLFSLQKNKEKLKSSWLHGKPYYVSALLLLVIGMGLYYFMKPQEEIVIKKTPQELMEEGKRYLNRKVFQKAFESFKEAAEGGNIDAQFELAKCYDNGIGTLKDPQKASEWYGKAANQKHAGAQYQFGLRLYSGNGVHKDQIKAVLYFRNAAEQGYMEAEYELGVCYFKGIGIKKNLKEAVTWFRRAAERGYAQAQSKLGYCYSHGKGIEKDLRKAVEWYNKSAAQDDIESLFSLARIYWNGDDDLKKDRGKARELIQKIETLLQGPAQKGNEQAKKWLQYIKYLQGKM